MIPVPTPLQNTTRSAMGKASRMEGRLAQTKIKERGAVSLDNKEEQFFDWDAKQGRSKRDMAWIRPDVAADEIGVPGYSRDDGNLAVCSVGEVVEVQGRRTYRDEKRNFADIKARQKRAVKEGEGERRRDGVLQVPGKP